MNTRPKSGVTVIITRSMGRDGWYADCYGISGRALSYQPRQVFPTVDEALNAARALYGDAIDRVRYWSPDHGYAEDDA